MLLNDFDFKYPEELIATKPVEESRVMWNENSQNTELNLDQLIEKFEPGDLLVLNNSKVVKKRIFAQLHPHPNNKVLEVLFLDEIEEGVWEVLFPASRMKDSHKLLLPEGVEAELVERGKPQKLRLNKNIDFAYFERVGELPLPPYIQKARGDRHQVKEDDSWYQTQWAEVEGSAAAPTASLHFKKKHLMALQEKGVEIAYVTLHVGLGTFLPVSTENLLDHEMHKEWIEIPKDSLEKIDATKTSGKKVWALGTTVTRSLESFAAGKLEKKENGNYQGNSDLFITPGFDYKVVDVLLTNFHQPKTTLLALVAAFTSLENLKTSYAWAIENKFRLFSYGDLSAWNKK